MNRFIKRGTFCLFFVISTLFATDIVYSHFVRPEGYTSSWDDLYNKNINSVIVIFGTSRAQCHIVSNIVYDSTLLTTYNLGSLNAHIETQLIRLKEYLKCCTLKPKHILLEVCFFSIMKMDDIDYHTGFYWLWNNNFSHYSAVNTGSYNKLDYYCPMIRYSGNAINYISKWIKKDVSDTCFRGYYNPFGNWDSELYNRSVKRCRTFEIDTLRILYVKEFIKTCIDNNININLIYTPENYLYKNCYTNKHEFLNLYTSIADSFKIGFKDFSNESIPINIDTTYYHDTAHLTPAGASKFTSEYFVPYIKELCGM